MIISRNEINTIAYTDRETLHATTIVSTDFKIKKNGEKRCPNILKKLAP